MLILEKKLLGQTYFAIQPRKHELSEIDYNLLPEDVIILITFFPPGKNVKKI